MMNAQVHFNEMNYSHSQTHFHLNAPSGAKSVKVRIYGSADAVKPLSQLTLKKSGIDTWDGSVAGNMNGKFYTFDIGHGECPGTFAKAVSINGKRGAIIDMTSTNPKGWNTDARPPLASPCDMIIYELHHRDFSIHPQSGFVHKGKFLALAEPKAIYHLKTLGVNAVQIQPSYDFFTVDESRPDTPQYNWGYDPLNYNVPEGSYSTDATRPEVRIKEFKQMVMAIHDAGIRVILDVVYNHCMDIEGSNFQRTYPDYYFRTSLDGGKKTYSNGSGCGNETASERPLMRKFMIESVKYWVKEYHIDGFRFDLMGIHDIETMNAIRRELDAIDPSITIHGEGWSAGRCAYPKEKLAVKAAAMQMPRIGAFGDEMRDGLRGPFDDDTKSAFLNAVTGNDESVKFGIVGGILHPQVDMKKVNYSTSAWCSQPSQYISYVSCHDDMCLTDRLKASIPGIDSDELARLDKLAQTFVILSQGVPFIYAGEEMMRNKQGVHNSYKSPDSINQLNWADLGTHRDVFLYYRELIAIRKTHKAFRMGDAEQVRKHLHFLKSPSCVIAFILDGKAVGDSWNKIVCIMNSNRTPQTVTIPEGTYTVVCRDGMACADGLGKLNGGIVTVAPQQALILYRGENTKN